MCGRLLARQGAKGGLHAGPSLVDRGRAGSKHVITDGHGTPLAVLLTGGNRNDVTQLLPLLDAVPPVRGRVGHPRRRPDSLFADRGYDQDVNRDQVRARGIVPPSLDHPPVGAQADFVLVLQPYIVIFMVEWLVAGSGWPGNGSGGGVASGTSRAGGPCRGRGG